MTDVQYGMAIDTKRCIGCWTCAVTCKAHNNVPDNVFWNRVMTEGGESMDTPAGTWPNLTMSYITFSCQHCEDSACVRVCPVGATYKREDGIVMQNPDTCLGCRMCMAACPYQGVRSFNWEEPHYAVDHAVGDADAPKHVKNTVEKCVFCANRLDNGLNPACVDGCPVIARHFGDVNDPESEISQLLQKRSYKQLLTEQGTGPNLYYLL